MWNYRNSKYIDIEDLDYEEAQEYLKAIYDSFGSQINDLRIFVNIFDGSFTAEGNIQLLDSNFKVDYTKEFVFNCGDMNESSWITCHVNWKEAAEQLMNDYCEIEVDDHIYYILD